MPAIMESLASHEMKKIRDASYDGMIIVDALGSVTLFNNAAERITGLRASNLPGRPAVDVIPDSRLHIVLASGAEELNQEQRIGNRVIMTNRVPVRDPEGTIVGAAAHFRDITEIRSLSDAVAGLWNVRSLLEAVIESTADAVSAADERGNTIIVNTA
jgi:PAS domain S-box-containing protein